MVKTERDYIIETLHKINDIIENNNYVSDMFYITLRRKIKSYRSTIEFDIEKEMYSTFTPYQRDQMTKIGTIVNKLYSILYRDNNMLLITTKELMINIIQLLDDFDLVDSMNTLGINK